MAFELDAGWAAAAGQDPVTWLRAHPHRFDQMYVKDIKATTKPNFILEQDPVEVGYGTIQEEIRLPSAHFEAEGGEPHTLFEQMASLGLWGMADLGISLDDRSAAIARELPDRITSERSPGRRELVISAPEKD